MISNAWKTGSDVRVTAVHDEDYLRYGDQGNGEGNGNPFQCSCLESPRDRGAWWAAVYRVAQSRTRPRRVGHSCIDLAAADQGKPLQE